MMPLDEGGKAHPNQIEIGRGGRLGARRGLHGRMGRGYKARMSAPVQIIHARPHEGAAFSAAGDVYRHLATSAQTGGAYVLTEARVLPGGGPPPHLHRREDEAFFMLEGEIVASGGPELALQLEESGYKGVKEQFAETVAAR